MNLLSDSTFLPLLVKSTGFLALAFLLWPLVRRQSAAFQSIYWRGAMLGLLVLGIFSLWVPLFQLEWPKNSVPAVVETDSAPLSQWKVMSTLEPSGLGLGDSVAVSSGVETDVAKPANILPTAWLCGALLLASLWLLARWRLSRVKPVETVSSPWNHHLEECRAALGFDRRLRLAFDEKIAMPCAWGIFRPTVLLPKNAEDWTEDRQRMVLMHEIAHLRRRDPLGDLIGRFAVTLFWLNPLVWFAFKQLRLAAERATDDAVIAGGCTAKSYAQLLLQFAREGLAQRRPALATAAPMAQGSTVGLRVEKILDVSQKRRQPRKLRALAMLAAIPICAAMVGGVQELEAQGPESDTVEPKNDAAAQAGVDYIRDKLKKIIIPEISFEKASLEEAVEFLRRAAAENDSTENNPEAKGINILIDGQAGAAAKETEIYLNLSNVPLGVAIQFTTDLAGCEYRIDPIAVVLTKKDSQLITHSWRVPAHFKQVDPNGRIVPAKTIFERVGIQFSEGASVSFIGATSEVVMRNTRSNLDLTQVYIDNLNANVPARVINLRVEMYALPKLQALELVESFDQKAEARDAVVALRKLVKEKQARLLETPSLMTRTGQRAKVGSGKEYSYVSHYTERKGEDVPSKKTIFFGTTFEAEPVIEADQKTLSINLAVRKTFGKPVIGTGTIAGPVSGKQLPVETVQIDEGKIQTAFYMRSGQTRLIGTLSPTQTESDELIVVFLKAWFSNVAEEVKPQP